MFCAEFLDGLCYIWMSSHGFFCRRSYTFFFNGYPKIHETVASVLELKQLRNNCFTFFYSPLVWTVGTLMWYSHKIKAVQCMNVLKNNNIVFILDILSAYRWLICNTLKSTLEKVDAQLKQGKDKFSVRNNTQSFYAVPLSLLFAEVPT